MNLVNVLCKIKGWSYGELMSKCRKMDIVSKRRVLSKVLRDLGYSLSEIGRMFGRSHSDIHHLINASYMTHEENEMYNDLTKIVHECGIKPVGQ